MKNANKKEVLNSILCVFQELHNSFKLKARFVRNLLRMHDGTHPIHMHTHCSPLQVGVCSDSADAAHMRRTGGGCAW